MTIHILETNDVPTTESMVVVACGKEMKFSPVSAEWSDGRICEQCTEIYSRDVDSVAGWIQKRTQLVFAVHE